MTVRWLVLDPSSVALGWAVGAGAVDGSGVYCPTSREAKSYTKDLRHREMCGRASNWFADLITREEPAAILIETGGGFRTDKCSERLRGALFAVCWIREIATATVEPSVWQAWAKRSMADRFAKWQTAGKPDDESARMMLAWAQATQTVEEG